MITAEDFIEATGREPVQDDMERVNCPEARQLGHFGCGWCPVEDRPAFDCSTCLAGGGHYASNRRWRKLNDTQ